ncbi:respiratory chain complex I subunit 1 family protein [Thermodesulfobacterium hveragerdense]|uniref:respiratory chain complex I subunit 1 family protein n=1 Tax=Thermodesulfobacterium hveragerdense TaxID=53424 RepID=UPI0003FE12ED|nr:complex I subunit 1 family protein [Thermodesulfobacterium hveragerdense]
MEFLKDLFLYPGFLFGFVLGGLLEGFKRKLKARMQLRKGPPVTQPFYDLSKLLLKNITKPYTISSFTYLLIPFVPTVGLLVGVLLMPYPFYQEKASFSFDLILIFYLTELPLLSQIIFGYFSKSPYGMVGAARAAQMFFYYNGVFIMVITTLCLLEGPPYSFCLKSIAEAWDSLDVLIKILTIPFFVFSVLAKLKLNPFSIPDAEAEILEGPLTEASGVALALFKLNYLLELAIFGSLFAFFYLPVLKTSPQMGLSLILLGAFFLFFMFALVENFTARLRLSQFSALYLKFLIPSATLILVITWVLKTW